VAALVVVALATAIAVAHVAPSVDDNNRYVKLTPLGDRVRLAYTVFFGEVPGASERRSLDRNRDGQIDEEEAHAFGTRIAAEVAAGLEVEVDGVVQPVHWEIVDVGMGTPAVAAGAFSVDLVTHACLASPRGPHRVIVRDRFRLPHPGETEVKVEDSPGVTIEHARVGNVDDPSYDYRFAGGGGPFSDEGLDLAFTAGPRSTVTPDATCAGAAAVTASGSHVLGYALAVVAVVAVVAVAVAAWLFRARRRKPRPGAKGAKGGV
jgi:hypothetical protein